MKLTPKKVIIGGLVLLGLVGAVTDDSSDQTPDPEDVDTPVLAEPADRSEQPDLSAEEQAAQEILDEQTPEPEPESVAAPSEPDKAAAPADPTPAPAPQPETPVEPAAPAEPTPAPAETTAEPSAETKPQSRTVYVTKTGKKYHYSNSCNGGTYYESTLDAATARGLKPCNKCT